MSLTNKYKNFLKKKRKVIVLTEDGIKSKEITNFSKILHSVFVVWFLVANISLALNFRMQMIKNKKIKDLKDINLDLNYKIQDLNYVVGNIKEYFVALNFYDRFEDLDVKKVSYATSKLVNRNYENIDEYNEILPILNNIDRDITNVEILVNSRINGLNDILSEVSLEQKAREIYNISYNNFNVRESNDLIFKNSILVKRGNFSELKNKIKYMNFLESFLNSMPIAKPIRNYYMSSKFGSRIDPFTKMVRKHNGLDLVGPYNATIYAAADGVVDLVANRRGFGNIVGINHGNDIRTEYAHLNTSLVKTGDVVKRGDKIAIQGSTGRSTGQHLHWEVKIKRESVDPIKFIRVSEKLF